MINKKIIPWYYEYILTYWDDVYNKEERTFGIVLAKSTFSAMKKIIKYYGDESIINIETLKAIEEGPILDFKLIMKNNKDFDFSIGKKDKVT